MNILNTHNLLRIKYIQYLYMSKQKKDNLYKKNKTIKKQKKVKGGCNCGTNTNTLFSNGGISGGSPFIPATYIDGYVNPSSMYPLNSYTHDPSIDGVVSSRLSPDVKYGGNQSKSKQTKHSKHKIRKNKKNKIEKTYKKTKGGNIFGQIVTLSNPLVSPESISLMSSNLSVPKYNTIRLVP